MSGLAAGEPRPGSAPGPAPRSASSPAASPQNTEGATVTDPIQVLRDYAMSTAFTTRTGPFRADALAALTQVEALVEAGWALIDSPFATHRKMVGSSEPCPTCGLTNALRPFKENP